MNVLYFEPYSFIIKCGYLLIIFILFRSNAKAQDDQNSIELTGIHSLGFFTPHNDSNNGDILLEGSIYGFEAAYKINMAANTADYIRMLNISTIDIVGSYRNYADVTENNNPKTAGFLGKNYILLGRLNMNLITEGPVSLNFTPAFGFAYGTQTYFTDMNFVLGSHMNLAAQGGLNLKVALSSTSSISGGFDILHISDGAYRNPNNGLNSFNMTIGITHSINTKGPIHHPKRDTTKKNVLEIGADIGRRGVFERKDGIYKSGLFAAYDYKVNQVLLLNAEFDAIYYYTVFNPANYLYTFQYYGSSYDRWRIGISLGADLVLGQLIVKANYGYYIHNNSPLPEKFYWIPGLQYDILSHLALQGKVYINKTNADYLGIGVVYKISGI